MAEQNAALGYAGLGLETTKGTAVTPTVYCPYYSQSLGTSTNYMSDEPVYGNKFKRYQTLQGLRHHGGSLTVMAEPNTAALWHNMLATKASTSGSNPYTHTFGASATDPKSYTLDVSYGSQVGRFFGVEASKITYGWDDEKMVFNIDVSGLGSFLGREIASISTTVLTLKTDGYDPTPTAGLVNSDLVAVKKVDGTLTTNFTVASFTATTVTLNATAAAFAAGDMLVLRAATPSLSILTPFLWGRTEFRFGIDAATALSATQVRMESGSELSLMHEFQDNEGAKRSGAFDPASLPRKQYDLDVKLKKFFDQPDSIKYWNARSKRALVMRAYSGATSQHELRVTINNLTFSDVAIPSESGGIIYEDITAMPNYDTTDTQGFSVVVIDALSTV